MAREKNLFSCVRGIFTSFSHRNRLVGLLRRIGVRERTFLIILSTIIGIVVGLGTVLFVLLLKGSSWLFGQFMPALCGGHLWLKALVPALGGLCLAPFILSFPSEATGHGVPSTMEAVALNNGFIRWANGFLSMILSVFTLGSGGSAGSEGPIIRIGSAFASGVGQFFAISGQRLRIIVACGAAAGLAAIFNAPVAGVLFAIEVVLGEFSVNSFGPIVISSVVATALSRTFLFHGALMQVPAYQTFSRWEILLYAAMGAAVGFAAIGFTRVMQLSEQLFRKRVRVPLALKPAIGGLLVGIMGLFVPQILGFSYVPIIEAIKGQFGVSFLLLLVGSKIISTSFTLGSGGSGGILCPSLFLGATLGSCCGAMFHQLFPHMVPMTGGYAIVGMGAMLGAMVQAPMAAIIMIVEITNDYMVILPIMAACIIATLIHQYFMKGSIYSLSLSERGIDIYAARETGILSNMLVRQIVEPAFETVPPSASYQAILKKCLHTHCNCLYVIGENEDLIGVISFSQLREFLLEDSLNGLVVAQDLADSNIVYVTPDESLASSLNKFSLINMEQLPVVVEHDGLKKITGIVTRMRLFEAYRQEILRRVLVRA
jgi:CIC family chloride channel protein